MEDAARMIELLESIEDILWVASLSNVAMLGLIAGLLMAWMRKR